jgi:hypothetical protein
VGVNDDATTGIVEVVTPGRRVTEIEVDSVVVDIINTATVTRDVDLTTYHLDVLRRDDEPNEVVNRAEVTDIWLENKSVINVGAGPQLPPAPVEGQIWILT